MNKNEERDRRKKRVAEDGELFEKCRTRVVNKYKKS